MERDSSGSKELAILTAAERRLAECTQLDEVLDVREEAEMVRIYAQKQRLGLQLQNHAAKVKIQAERRIGEALRAMKLRGGDRKSDSHDESLILRLSDMGIDRNQSSRWQQEASISRELFEAFCHDIENRGEELSSSAFLRFVKFSNGGKHRPQERRKARPTDNELPRPVNGSPVLGQELAEIHGHLQTVDRMFEAICKRKSSHLEAIEAREIPRYLQEAMKLLREVERHLSVIDRR